MAYGDDGGLLSRLFDERFGQDWPQMQTAPQGFNGGYLDYRWGPENDGGKAFNQFDVSRRYDGSGLDPRSIGESVLMANDPNMPPPPFQAPQQPMGPLPPPNFQPGTPTYMGEPRAMAYAPEQLRQQQPLANIPPGPQYAQAGPPQAPGFGDRLGAGATGFFNAKSPMEAIGNLIGGIGTGQAQDRRSQALRIDTDSREGRYRAVLGAGGTPAQAQAAAASEDVFKALAPDMFGAPKVVKVGTDSMGREIYKMQKGGKLFDLPGGNNQGSGAIDNPGGLTGEDYLKSIEPAIANTVRGILEGRMQPPSSFAASKPYWQTILQHAANAEPGFDLTTWGSRLATKKDFASGMSARNVTALNTVIGHLGSLMEKSDALGNTSFQYLNDAKNWAIEKTGGTAPGQFRIARDAVANELAKVFRSTGMSETDIREWKNNISSSSSPDQFKAQIATGIDLVNSRVDSMKDQYRRGAKQEAPELLAPESLKVLGKLQTWAAGGEKEKPAGAREGATATNPKTGEKVMFKNGQWVPVK